MPSARRLLEHSFTVETIMTPRAELLTWERGADLASVLDTPGKLKYDVIPVQENGRITGVLCAAAEPPEPLTSSWLVSRDTSISDLLDLFVQTQRPGLLVFHRQDVVGLVTPADMNKLPARFYLYGLLGDIEMALSGRVREVMHDATEIIGYLNASRQGEVQKKFEELRQSNLDTDPVQLLTLVDLFSIIERHPVLRESLGFASKSQVEKMTSGLNDLRNQTMHTNRLVLERLPDDVVKLRERLEKAEALWQRLYEG